MSQISFTDAVVQLESMFGSAFDRRTLATLLQQNKCKLEPTIDALLLMQEEAAHTSSLQSIAPTPSQPHTQTQTQTSPQTQAQTQTQSSPLPAVPAGGLLLVNLTTDSVVLHEKTPEELAATEQDTAPVLPPRPTADRTNQSTQSHSFANQSTQSHSFAVGDAHNALLTQPSELYRRLRARGLELSLERDFLQPPSFYTSGSHTAGPTTQMGPTGHVGGDEQLARALQQQEVSAYRSASRVVRQQQRMNQRKDAVIKHAQDSGYVPRNQRKQAAGTKAGPRGPLRRQGSGRKLPLEAKVRQQRRFQNRVAGAAQVSAAQVGPKAVKRLAKAQRRQQKAEEARLVAQYRREIRAAQQRGDPVQNQVRRQLYSGAGGSGHAGEADGYDDYEYCDD